MTVESEDVIKNLVDQLSRKSLEVAQLNAYIEKLEQDQGKQQGKPEEAENNG